jgi:hypothetical protein
MLTVLFTPPARPRLRALKTVAACALASAMTSGVLPQSAEAKGKVKGIQFSMVPSPGAAKCLPHATALVTVTNSGGNDTMTVQVAGLPPDDGFDFFVIQVPNAPFGLAWYQGDIETNSKGVGAASFIGVFDIETFIVAPGTAPAPVVFKSPPFPDASSNPKTGPVHEYHLGLWFGSPAEAAKAGCPAAETPFNGTHNAGIQVLNTANFAELSGPLRFFNP